MCLILIREPEVPIDFINIEAAADNNPHGWGYVIPDRGKLEIRRFYDKKGTNPDDVMRVIEDNPDKQLFLHLRFCTHGDRSKANVHPFPALQKRKDGMQVWVMHNGTVSGFKEAGNMSDTYHFTDKLISPLLKRFLPFTGKKRLLQDPMLADIIEKYAGSWSKFVLIDEYGGYQIVGDGTSPKPGLWLSNEYSFKPKYRYPEKVEKKDDDKDDYKAYGYSSTYGTNYGRVFTNQEVSEEEYAEFWPDNSSYTPPFPREVTVTEPIVTGGKLITDQSTPKKEVPLDERVSLEPKDTFADLWGCGDIREISMLTEEDIYEMSTDYPEHMTLLVRDLILLIEDLDEQVAGLDNVAE